MVGIVLIALVSLLGVVAGGLLTLVIGGSAMRRTRRAAARVFYADLEGLRREFDSQAMSLRARALYEKALSSWSEYREALSTMDPVVGRCTWEAVLELEGLFPRDAAQHPSLASALDTTSLTTATRALLGYTRPKRWERPSLGFERQIQHMRRRLRRLRRKDTIG